MTHWISSSNLTWQPQYNIQYSSKLISATNIIWVLRHAKVTSSAQMAKLYLMCRQMADVAYFILLSLQSWWCYSNHDQNISQNWPVSIKNLSFLTGRHNEQTSSSFRLKIICLLFFTVHLIINHLLLLSHINQLTL